MLALLLVILAFIAGGIVGILLAGLLRAGRSEMD